MSAQLTKTLINKRDRAMTNAEKALSQYNDVIEEVAQELQDMGEDVRSAYERAEGAAESAQDVLDEVREYALNKQAAAEDKDKDDEADAWSEIAESHDTECTISPGAAADVCEDMSGADITCLVTDFVDEA